MHKLSLLMLAATATASEFHAIAERVNAAGAGWTAAAPTRFNSTAAAKVQCGTFLPGHPLYVQDGVPVSTLEVRTDLPESFDARDAFPTCASLIGHVRDQSACGSCWAFATTEAFETRRCIATGDVLEFSEEDTNACCNFAQGCFSMGCNGGQVGNALSWMAKHGVVSGGDYGAEDRCLPYSMEPCAHHVDGKKYAPCPSGEYSTPRCKTSCVDAFTKREYADDKVSGGRVSTLRSVDQIKTALVTGGPVATGFTVYSDFPTYTSGVYKHTSGSSLGGHAVLIVGYGTEDNTPYWLVKNSWNEEWGANGFFKIAHGQCGIDDAANAIDF